MEPGRFLKMVEHMLPEEVSVHPGVAAVTSNSNVPNEETLAPAVAKASVSNKKASMDQRRAQIERVDVSLYAHNRRLHQRHKPRARVRVRTASLD